MNTKSKEINKHKNEMKLLTAMLDDVAKIKDDQKKIRLNHLFALFKPRYLKDFGLYIHGSIEQDFYSFCKK